MTATTVNALKAFNTNTENYYYDRLHREKYRDENQSHLEHCEILSRNIGTDPVHMARLYSALCTRRFLPAGRLQAALGATEREVSPFNCAVSQTIEDSMDSIMESVSKAAKILRLGTGIGFNFSRLRPHGAEIKKLKTQSSGPLSFAKIHDVMASTIASSGHRRGAMMGIMNVDHPDIEEFIDAKLVPGAYRQFNFSVGVTDAFMQTLSEDGSWPLSFGGVVYKEVSARGLWDKIVRNAFNSAEPGVIFIDRLNSGNNLYYCEHIEATNPCAEQPLPPNGLCLLGSFNLIAYVDKDRREIDFDTMRRDIFAVVEGYDNIFDDSTYAIPEHKAEAISKRRMGLGFTSIANGIELLCSRPNYGEPEFCNILKSVASFLCYTAYEASAKLAERRGPFSLFDKEKYLGGRFIKSLPDTIRKLIVEHGIRNSHLISYAPCGTISQTAGNVSSGVEPIFYHSVNRKVYMRDGLEDVTLTDYNYRIHGFKGKTLDECNVDDHMAVAKAIQPFTDSAISKTVNVAASCSYQDYERIYRDAYAAGLKGITVFRPTNLRGSVITESCSVSGECK
jgi:ribonucleoside-diphosphate reductase alpha chain